MEGLVSLKTTWNPDFDTTPVVLRFWGKEYVPEELHMTANSRRSPYMHLLINRPIFGASWGLIFLIQGDLVPLALEKA